MEDSENQFDSMTQKLIKQELRISQQALRERTKECEDLRVREQTLVEGARWERSRTKAQEDRVVELQRELERCQDDRDSFKMETERLQKELSKVRRQDEEFVHRKHFESEIVNYRTRIAGLESKLARRQVEFEKSEDAFRIEIEKLERLVENAADRYDSGDTYSVKKENMDVMSMDSIAQLHYNMGNLKANYDRVKDEIARVEAAKEEIENELKQFKEEMESVKELNKALEKQLTEQQGNSDNLSKYYSDEIQKIKNQKAEVRYELFRLKKEHEKLNEDVKTGKIGDHEVEKCETEMASLKKKNTELQQKVDEFTRQVGEAESSKEGEVNQLKKDLLAAKDEIEQRRHVERILEEQCDKTLAKATSAFTSIEKKKKQITELETELSQLRENLREYDVLKADNSRYATENEELAEKNEFLRREIEINRTDHRKEIADLARAAAERGAANNGSKMAELEKKVFELESQLRQTKSSMDSLSRQVDQKNKEISSAQKTLSKMRDEQVEILTENTTLKKSVLEAINKIKSYKEESENLAGNVKELETEMQRLREYEDELHEKIDKLETDITLKDQKIEYLQSMIQPKKIEKQRFHDSRSLLITGPEEEMDIESLEKQRFKLEQEFMEKNKELVSKREKIVPLMKASSIASDSSISGSLTSLNMPNKPPGTMRHNIPHRFQKTFILSSTMCHACSEQISFLSHGYKCKCNIVIHLRCKNIVQNTCGLPQYYANYYVENHKIDADRVSGWVKIWLTGGTPGSKWKNTFAILGGNNLSFYDSDVAVVQHDAPFLAVDLSQEKWRLYSQTGTPAVGIEQGKEDCLIEIKLKDKSLHMLTHTPDAKRQWVEALHGATDRHLLERSASQKNVMSIYGVGRLEHSLLTFQCTEFLGDWLLIGAAQGLFATKLLDRQFSFAPLSVGGYDNVLQLKYIKEQGVLFAIDTVDRKVTVALAKDVLKVLESGAKTPVLTTVYNEVPPAHLFEVSETRHSAERYVYVATTDDISVFHFSSKIDGFRILTTIKMDVPARCILSVPNGFVYGTDTFYHVQAGMWHQRSFQTDWAQDVPISIVRIDDDEILTVFHNFGVFTTPEGDRTRLGDIEWERVPNNVIYIEPYLFVVYKDIVSICRVLPRSDCNREDSPLIEELDAYKAPGVRVTGMGKNPGEVFVSVSTDTRTELDCFSLAKLPQKRKTGISSSQLQPNSKRRY